VGEISMTGMFRRDQTTVPIDDIVAAGQRDWDGRVKLAMASESAWKRATFGCLGVIVLLAGGMTYQAVNVAPPTIIHVVHNSLGGVIAVSATTEGSEAPNQIQIKAAVEQWIINCRTVYVDINAMRRSLGACANMVERGSQADIAMARFYNTPHKEEPFVRAQTETVAEENVVAVPPTASDVGQHQTWSVTWVERVTSRDGSVETIKPWAANVTLTVKAPTTTEEAQRNPNGLHVVAWSWTEK
jgi:type IV secretion system protein TrbF